MKTMTMETMLETMTTETMLEIIRNYIPARQQKISVFVLIRILDERGEGAAARKALGREQKKQMKK